MKKGLTQIELLIVMAVVSIIAIYSYSVILSTSDMTKIKSLERDKLLLIEKQKLYYEKYGKFMTITQENNE